MSAGYGLVHEDERIASYGATFTPGTPDSISEQASTEESMLWWEFLSIDESRGGSIFELAHRDPSEAVVVVASPSYLSAATNDLLNAGNLLEERLVIISIGGRNHSGLKRHLIDIDARIEHLVGGSRTALNAKTASHLLMAEPDEPVTVSSIQRIADLSTQGLPAHKVWNRETRSDEELGAWIRERLSKEHMSRTRLLMILRSEGHACEQRRFARLYEKVAP